MTIAEYKPDVAVIILTKDEEKNIEYAAGSVAGWAKQVFVFDSFSSDRTLEIARRYGCICLQNPFVNYAQQRNDALRLLPIETEWVLFLDADERCPEELKAEISKLLSLSPKENGFFLKYKFIWRERWIRRGYYPSWILRLCRRKRVSCSRSFNEYLVIDGKVGYLQSDLIHEDHKGLGAWLAKHRKYAQMEADELRLPPPDAMEMPLSGSQAQVKRWVRYRIWNRLPPLIRPSFYFFYRFILRGGILDGPKAWQFHFLQAFWFPMLIDLKYLAG
jgi:glycosyltransferase involved in cell wall biosynthesis